MAISSSVYVLMLLYALFVGLGVLFFRLTAKMKPFHWRFGNKALNFMRFSLYVGLLPVGLTCATAIFMIYASYSGN